MEAAATAEEEEAKEEEESWYEVERDGGTTRPADPRRPDVDRCGGQAERNGPRWINYH